MKDTAPPPAVQRRYAATPSWQDCHRAGMTAKEAAEARGMTLKAARSWATYHKVKWASPPHSLRQREAVRPSVYRHQEPSLSEMDRTLNAVFAAVFGDRWEGPQ